ncbi:MAG: sigma factor-like helix-turn-helix DNA-binding protein, partial [Pseudomonadota bacterium]
VEDVPLAGLDEGEPDRRMDRELLYNAINQLESDYRDPLLLQVIGGFSGKEIASILDLNSNTVMTRLFRARSKLRDMFGTSGPDQDPEA